MTNYLTEENRFLFTSYKREKLSYGSNKLDETTNGGIPLGESSLQYITAATGKGKTLFLANLAASAMLQGKKVLFLTLEESKECIWEHIQAIILREDMYDLRNYDSLLTDKINQQTDNLTELGELYVSEVDHSLCINTLLMRIHNDFQMISDKPDIIIIDEIRKMDETAQPYFDLSRQLKIPVICSTRMYRKSYCVSSIESFESLLYVNLFLEVCLESKYSINVTQIKNMYASIVDKSFRLPLTKGRSWFKPETPVVEDDYYSNPVEGNPIVLKGKTIYCDI